MFFAVLVFKILTFLLKSLQICSILTFREAHHLLEELVVGVDNDGEGGDEVEQQQDLYSYLHLSKEIYSHVALVEYESFR